MANPFERFYEEVVEPAFDFASDIVEDIGDFATEVVGEVISWFYKPDIPDINRDILVNKQSNIAPIPVIYGRRRIGGTRVAVALSDNKKDLYVVLAMCEGEIEQIESIYIDDVISTDARFTGKVTINQYLGTDSQTADSMLTAAFPSLWTSNHRLRGIAYLACKFVYDPEVFRSIPTINAVVKGRKVYDPRNSTTAYSDNPALCLLDYLTNSRYGKGLSLTDIDTQSFEDAATDCDLAVTKYTGAPTNTEIFRCNAVIDTGQTIFENVKIMLSGMRGLLPYQNGKYGLKIEQDSSSVMSFNTDNMLNGVSFSVLGKDKRYNKVTAKFVNPDANWQVDSVVWPESGSSEETTFLTEDDNVELSTEITLPTCTDFYAARDLARLVCLASRKNNLVVSFAATSDALKVQAGDIIDFTYDSANLSAQKFRVQEVTLSSSGAVQIGAQKHDATIYPWATYAIYDSLGDLGEVSVYGTIDPPSNLSISSSLVTQPSNIQEVSWQVSWTASDAINLAQYEVEFKKSSDSIYTSFFTTETSWAGVGGVLSGENYDVRVRAVITNGSKSAFVSGSHSMAGGMTPIEDGEDGAPGANGNDGAGTYYYALSGSTSVTPNQSTLDSYFALASSNKTKVEGDVLVLRNDDDEVQAYIYDESATNWVTQAAFIDGNLLVAGTITTDRLNSGNADSNFSFTLGNTTLFNGLSFDALFASGGANQGGGTTYSLATTSVAGKGFVSQIVDFNNNNYAAGEFYNSTSNFGTTHRQYAYLATRDYAVEAYGPIYCNNFVYQNFTSTSSSANHLITFTPAAGVQTSYADSGLLFRPDTNELGVGQGTGTGTSGAVNASAYYKAGSFIAFTEGHDTLLANTHTAAAGDIIVDTGVAHKKDINNTLCYGAVSTSANQKGAIGVYTFDSTLVPIALKVENTDQQIGEDSEVLDSSLSSLLDDYQQARVNSLGEGQINVCNEGGNIEIGDLIVTSSMSGKGMKQSDDIVRSYTVAKARESATFASNTEVKQVACIYLCG